MFKITTLVDQLGNINAQISALQNQSKAIKKELIDNGIENVEGAIYVANISTQYRENLDMEAVRKHLSPQFISAHTKTAAVTSVRVSVRKDLKLAA